MIDARLSVTLLFFLVHIFKCFITLCICIMITIRVFILFTRITVSDFIFLHTRVYHVEGIFATDAATALMLSYLLPIRWQYRTANPNSGLMVLMLAYLLPIRWKNHTANPH